MLKNVGVRTYPERGVHGEIVHSLGSQIVSGELSPGVALFPEALGEQFGASRTVVREALKVLASKGLVDSVRKRGTFVTPAQSWNRLDPDVLNWRFNSVPDGSTLESVSEVRLAMEPFAARLAAERRSDDDIERMEDALIKMAQAVRETSLDPDLFTESDLQFHGALFDATKNEILASFSQVMQSGLATRDRMVHSQRKFSEANVKEHRRVLNAIVAGDPEWAEEQMRNLLVAAAREQQVAFNE